MTKITNSATFSTGRTIVRKSNKHFAFAWLAINVQGSLIQGASGFSSTEQGAIRSASAHFSGFGGKTTTEVVKTTEQA